MPMERLTFANQTVWFKEMKATDRLSERSSSREHPAVCALSGNEIKTGDSVFLVLTNWVLFDNCWVLVKEVDRIGWDKALSTICIKYRSFVRLHAECEPHRRIFGEQPITKLKIDSM